MLTRSMPIQVVIGGLVALALFVAGVFSEVIAVGVGAGALLFSAILLRNARRSYEGVAELGPEHLLVRTLGVTQSYAWPHISQVEVIRLRDIGAAARGLYWVFGVDRGQRLVRIRLRRSLRHGLSGKRIGTDSDFIGIRVPGMKVVHLFLRDPDSFTAAAGRYLEAAGSHSS